MYYLQLKDRSMQFLADSFITERLVFIDTYKWTGLYNVNALEYIYCMVGGVSTYALHISWLTYNTFYKGIKERELSSITFWPSVKMQLVDKFLKAFHYIVPY